MAGNDGTAPKSTGAPAAGAAFVFEGTLICTERGEVPIEALRPDDILWTKEYGWQVLRLVTCETVAFGDRDDPAKPVLIPAGALGSGQPREDLIIAPEHRLLRNRPGRREEVLVPARELIGQNGIRQMRGKKKAHYFNVVLERHSIIQAAGCWVESLLVTPRSLACHHKAARRLLQTCIHAEPAKRVVPIGVRKRHLKRTG